MKIITSAFLHRHLLILLLFIAGNLQAQINNPNVVFEEQNGILAVEAEYFHEQTKSDARKWYRTSKMESPAPGQDPDGPHVAGSANNAYLELLPDTRTTHGDELISGVNFQSGGEPMAVLSYKVQVNSPGKYYVWVRAYSTGSEDNGLHVGLDGEWPESGQRMQWCSGKNEWTWESKQRTNENHCGEEGLIFLNIDKAGAHTIHFSMREDGFEFDKWVLSKEYVKPTGTGPAVNAKGGNLPEPFANVDKDPESTSLLKEVAESDKGVKIMRAINFPTSGTNYYTDKNTWLAINPEKNKEATATNEFGFPSGTYDLVFLGVGENDGKSSYEVRINDRLVGKFTSPLSQQSFEEGGTYTELWENEEINKGDKISVKAVIGSADGQEYSRGRWSGIAFAPMTKGKDVLKKLNMLTISKSTSGEIQVTRKTPWGEKVVEKQEVTPELSFTNPAERFDHGDGTISMEGELKQWHKVTLLMDGPFAHELDNEPNPFKDYKMEVTFTHESGEPSYKVPAYFAADGNAGETSADRGTKWKAHFSPDKTGKWTYQVSFERGENVAIMDVPWSYELEPYHGKKGEFEIASGDKSGRDFRARGRLEYVGKHYLQFQGDKSYFFKAGADAPETLLAYSDIDGTYTVKRELKTWSKHVQDWSAGDPSWQNGKGKGLIGAVNYLAAKGANAFSFLTYNAGGDGDNVWPFVERNDKYHYDCSKLDQWGVVFDHGQSKGMYLHFKTQETENDDNKRGKNNDSVIIESLDGGALGPQRRLYYRELMARYSYLLALNWNIGEENTQTPEQQREIARYLNDLCPYDQNIVIHTFPNEQDKIYPKLLGSQSLITGASLQNEWDHAHIKTLQWVKESAKVNRPWVAANDEQGSAGTGVPPDAGYMGFDAEKLGYDNHDIRKQTLWGNLMAGGAGVEYYFGYKLPENDLVCEDFRSRDKSWDYCKVAIDFFDTSGLPFIEMTNRNDLIGNTDNEKEKYCLAKENDIYLVYLGYVNTSKLDLSGTNGSFDVTWLNPRKGGKTIKGKVKRVKGGGVVDLGTPPSEVNEDWLVMVKKRS
ncbi:MAG: DUF5060 domain-containing protein [Cyclobacteriaceae bacterium]